MNKKITILTATLASLFVPVLANAAALGGVNDILMAVQKLLNLALPIAFGLAMLFFFWGIARFILAEGNPSAKVQSRQFLVWGVIAIFVISSVWGLVKFIGDSFGITTGVTGASTSNGAQLNPQLSNPSQNCQGSPYDPAGCPGSIN